jgi:hypothetical protein
MKNASSERLGIAVPASRGRRTAFLVGALVAAVTVAVVVVARAGREDAATEAPAVTNLPEGKMDRQKGSPLVDSQKVTIGEAKQMTPYALAVPATNEMTGDLTFAWIDTTDQVAMVWKSDLTFYQHAQGEVTEAEAVAEWTEKAAGPGEWKLVQVNGHVAIGHDVGLDRENQPAGVTWYERGLVLQLVAPNHTLAEVVEIASSTKFE